MYDYMATILDQKKQKEKPKMFTLKKWSPVAMWSWDVQCDLIVQSVGLES